MSVYLDANVLVSFVVADTFSMRARSFLKGGTGPFLVCDYAGAEVVSAVGRLVRTRNLTAGAADEALQALSGWVSGVATPIAMDSDDVRVAGLVMRQWELGLRTPDALHIAAAQRYGASLATFDARMAEAARKLGVPAAKI